ncbi:MAG: DAK2 domain-containing protein [Oscillospiraceae bacterium]|jgi:DAK2 domain fusion protein YloV|nr:DAK2 domain-containing protein [Oscillospiraceae bacterium]
MITTIDGALFARMILHGSACINAQKQEINELNVFPVPDGDTGTNMSMTFGAAAEEMGKKPYSAVGAAANATANALLRGARGNSGVILSLLFRGFAKAVKEKETIDGRDFAIALDFGVAAAYKAVMKPAEGTILTVSRLSAAAAAAAAREDSGVEYVLEKALAEGYVALENTTEQNPVLKKAGVVDSGGKGFLVILQGMLDEMRGKPMPEGASLPEPKKTGADFAALGDEDITFTYDTVFIVRKARENVNLEPYRAYLNSIGDSLVIGESDEEFKVHVHTDTPGAALTESAKYGILELAKIENMRTQAEDLAAGKHVQSTDDLDAVEAELEGKPLPPENIIAAPEKRYGMVAVAAGEGLAAVFKDLGVDGVISGGQTMNPSTEDILRQINATPAEVVFVLPNNKNIIMAAEQCKGLAEGKEVVVIPSKTVPQGIATLLVMDPDADVETNVAAMTEAMSGVSTAEVTYAARDSDFGGFAIKHGDHMALLNGQLFDTQKNQEKLLKKLCKEDTFQNAEFINIYYGEDVKESEAEKTLKLFTAACPKAEITLLSGGQPVYYYMISAE